MGWGTGARRVAEWRILAQNDANLLFAVNHHVRRPHVQVPCAQHRRPTPAVSNFASVKLPAALVQQAREAALPQRRSVAGQIEYWATLGRIADETGLTVQEAREAIAQFDARQRKGTSRWTSRWMPLKPVSPRPKPRGRLAQAVRDAVRANAQGAADTRRAA